jgi:hypothetical protein
VLAGRLKRSFVAHDGAVSGFVRQHFPMFKAADEPHYAFRPLDAPVFQRTLERPEHPQQEQRAPIYHAPPVHEPAPQSETTLQNLVTIDDVPLATRLEAMEWQRRQQQFVLQFNAALPVEHQVTAHSILPSEIFGGDLGRFLMLACNFYGHCFSNTLLLPKSSAGAQHFRLPMQSAILPALHVSDAKSRISQLRSRVANEHTRIANAVARGDVSVLFKQKEPRFDYKQELAGICRSMAINALGLSAYVTHESLFSQTLQSAKN